MQNLYDHQPLHLSAVKDQPREYHVKDTEGITCHGLVRVFKVEHWGDPVIINYRPSFVNRLLSRELPVWVINREITDPKASANQLWFWISHFKVETKGINQNTYGIPNIYEENFVYNFDTKEYMFVTTSSSGDIFRPELEVKDKAAFKTFDFLGECDLSHIEAAINRYLKLVDV